MTAIPAAILRQTPGHVTSYRLDTRLVRPYKTDRGGRAVLVYTPPGYDDPENAGRRYPVLYLLHGAPGNPGNFIKLGRLPQRLEREAGLPPVLLVLPDGNCAGAREGDGEWVNSNDGRDRFEDWIVREVVPWADARFRTLPGPDGRILGGVSTGGYGAVNIALRNPGLFGGVLSLSGYFNNGGFGSARSVMGYDAAFLRANSPLRYVADAVDAGRVPPAWRSTRFFLGAGANEREYTRDTRDLAAELRAIEAPVTLRLARGAHDWELWSELFLTGVKTLLRGGDGVSPSASP